MTKKVTWGGLKKAMKEAKVKDSMEIWMSSDPEGNAITPLVSVSVDEDLQDEEGPEHAIVLWPAG